MKEWNASPLQDKTADTLSILNSFQKNTFSNWGKIANGLACLILTKYLKYCSLLYVLLLILLYFLFYVGF